MTAKAQEAAPRAEATGGEIIVTARKREESAIKVPIVETVLTQEKIEQSAIVDLKDIASFAPGMVVGESVLSVGTQVSIRGIGTNTLDPGVDQSIAMVIDGFAFTQGLAFQSGTFDLAQIEVLKGPQALFFGKSSPAGVISMRTADPGDEMELIARGMYEIEARTRRVELIYSTPIGDYMGFRLAGQYHKSDGFFHNRDFPNPGTGSLAPKDRLGGNEGYHIRGTFTLDPDPSFSARLKLNYVDDFDEYPGAFQLTGCPEGIAPAPGRLPTINPNEECKLNRTFYLADLDPVAFPAGLNKHGGMPYGDKQQFYGTLEMNLEPTDGFTLTSVTGYYDLDFETYFNTFNAAFTGSNFASNSFYDREEMTQEIRLNSDLSGPFNFTVGGFYQNVNIDYLQQTARNIAIFPTGAPLVSAQSSPLRIDSLSAFGQLRYRPVEQIEIAAGARYTDETRKNFNTNAITGAPIRTANPRLNSQTLSPEATVSYFPNDDMTVFASYKKGYKPGSYSLSRLPTATPPALPDNSFEDEKAEGGEVGFKARLADGQLMTNIAGYYYKYSGLQFSVSAATAVGALPTVQVVNAGSAEVYGIDFETSYRPIWADGLNFNLAVNWNKAKFLDLAGVPCYGGQTIALGCNQAFNGTNFTAQANQAGTALPRAPEWTVNFGLAYDLPLSNGWTLTLTNDNHYQSWQLLNLGIRDEYRQDGYIKVDLGAFVKGEDDMWEVGLIGKNLFNKITSGTCASSNYANGGALKGTSQFSGRLASGIEGVDEVACIPERGRSVMIRLTVKPFG